MTDAACARVRVHVFALVVLLASAGCVHAPPAPEPSAATRCSQPLHPIDAARGLNEGCGQRYLCSDGVPDEERTPFPQLPSFPETKTPLDLVLFPIAVAAAVSTVAGWASTSVRMAKCAPLADVVRHSKDPAKLGFAVDVAAAPDATRDARESRRAEAWARFDAAPGDEGALAGWLNACEVANDRDAAKTAWRRFLGTPGAGPSHRLAYAEWLWAHRFGDEALLELQQLEAQTPRPRGLASLEGRLLLDLDRPDEARAALEQALTEEPDDADAREALDHLDER